MDSPPTSAPSTRTPDVLERITLQMASSLDLQQVLATITQGLVNELDGAFARIWLLGPGDLCADCYKAADCTNRARCLHLEASAGLYTNLNGEYRRIPLGALKIGKIAQGFGSMHTNDVLGDDRLPNKQWMNDNGLCSFAGHPLKFRWELLGVIAMFGRRPLSEEEFERLAVFANQAAIAKTRNSLRRLHSSRANSRPRTSIFVKRSSPSTISRRSSARVRASWPCSEISNRWRPRIRRS
jgi:GAF domain-containing protein